MKRSRFARWKWSLTLSLVLFVFAVLIVTMILGGLIVFNMHNVGMFHARDDSHADNVNDFLLLMIGICVILGPALTGFFSRKALNPIRRVIEAIHKVSEGDFKVKVDIKGISELEELSESFNKMTLELSSIETLRSDFINNFSHEFKTPIVSLRGFAKLLKDGDLTEAERQEYLDIIITESERLSELSTNVLNLSKYETLDIVTDKEQFRLDEQIRRTLVILEPKWSKKDLYIDVELDEILYDGNSDLIQQIWINLLDNAIKFSPAADTIKIRLEKLSGSIRVAIRDNGIGMDEQTKDHIFDKFYQGDLSHAKTGYGLGLAIVRRIVQLCGGTIEVQSALGEGSTFTVSLPE